MLRFPLAQSTWMFDAPSFVIGLVAGLLIAGLLYLFRQPLGDGVERARAGATRLRDRLTAGAQQRYLEALRDRIQELHIGELSAPLADVYVPPRFSAPTPRPSLTLDAAQPESITLRQALVSTQRLAVLGGSGSGRTALLAYLASLFAESETGDKLRLHEERLPILVHLAEIDWSIIDDDPDISLIEAAIVHAPRLIAANLTASLKRELAGRRLLVLLDGWDEITADDQEAAQTWLAELVTRYPHHRYVITASAMDVEPLSRAGFACLSIAPLQASAIRALAERWAAAAEGGERDAAMLAESMRQPPGVAPRPLDATLAASVWRKRGAMPMTIPSAYDRWIDLALAESGVQDAATARSVLGQLAWTLLSEERPITTQEETGQLTADSPPALEPGKPDRSAADIAQTLAKESSLLIPLGQGVAFAHRRIAAYLAAAYAHNTGQGMALAAHLDDPAWDDVLMFFAAIGDATPLVNAALTRPDDLFRTTYRRLGEWASLAPADAAWRNRIMSEMVKTLMSPATPEPLREEILRTIVSTRDKGLAFLFKQATARSEPALRRLGLRGFALLRREADTAHIIPLIQDADASVRLEAIRALGETGGQAAVEALAQVLLDLDDDSRRAAAEALANCGKAGWDLLKEGAAFTDDQGADALRVRRASAYGLAGIGQAWARETLVRLERDDKQWFVRSGATEALQLANAERSEGAALDLSPLDKDNLGWLIQWAASKGQSIGMGKSAEQALQRALEDSDPNARLAAVHTYAHLGDAASIPALRQSLKDEDAQVRDAAYRALQAIALKQGEFVPQA